MSDETPRFGLGTYEKGDEDWSHTDTVEAVDEYAIARGPIADRPDEGSYDDELYFATDQRILWRYTADNDDWRALAGLGAEGHPVPAQVNVESLATGSVSIGDSTVITETDAGTELRHEASETTVTLPAAARQLEDHVPPFESIDQLGQATNEAIAQFTARGRSLKPALVQGPASPTDGQPFRNGVYVPTTDEIVWAPRAEGILGVLDCRSHDLTVFEEQLFEDTQFQGACLLAHETGPRVYVGGPVADAPVVAFDPVTRDIEPLAAAEDHEGSDIACLPDERLLLFPRESSTYVVVDPVADEVEETVTLPDDHRGWPVGWTPDGRLLANEPPPEPGEGDHRLVAIDPAAIEREVLRTYEIDEDVRSMFGMALGGGRYLLIPWASDGTGSFAVYDVTTNAIQPKTVDLHDYRPKKCVLLPDGQVLLTNWMLPQTSPKIAIYDVGADEITQELDMTAVAGTEFANYEFAVPTPDGTIWLTPNGSAERFIGLQSYAAYPRSLVTHPAFNAGY